MEAVALEALKYPVGKHEDVKRFERRAVNAGIELLAAFPSQARSRLEPLTEAQLEKRYRPGGWAELPDYRGPIGLALDGLEYIHARWVALMRSMSDEEFRKAFLHPETGTWMTLYDRVACYVWHGRHHVAHIEAALRG